LAIIPPNAVLDSADTASKILPSTLPIIAPQDFEKGSAIIFVIMAAAVEVEAMVVVAMAAVAMAVTVAAVAAAVTGDEAAVEVTGEAAAVTGDEDVDFFSFLRPHTRGQERLWDL
jgi:hypothetical protein